MNSKIGRNEPCRCGSGKKYKHCCGKPAAPLPATSHEGAVESVLGWLAQHHRKAFAAALGEAIDDALCEAFDDENEARKAMSGVDEALWTQVQINFTEWLLAEGDIWVKGERRRVTELLLGPGGPLLSVGQRAWLEQLARRPLRLYDVTEVVPGVGLTLCDALDAELQPREVIERAGSQSLRVGMQIGARVMDVDGRHQLSGCIYPFAQWAGRALQSRLRASPAEDRAYDEDDTMALSISIIDAWLAQHLVPPPPPEIVHGHTGEPLVFTTDHYEVRDWDALAAALAAQPGVDGDRDAGWDHVLECDDGLVRSLATVAAQPGGKRVSVFYQTAGLAEQGRAWFEALASGSVKFLLQEVSDPKGLLSRADASAPRATAPALPAGMDPETLAGAIEAMIQRTYANWADEPVPALNDQTPRQAMQSATGLERVKGLLRSYEDGEGRQAAQQGRREVSYQFLWDALGLAR